ncbi:MAG: beta-N-acetylhexosaminidase, partial [Ginsengibacter sp.]
MHKKALLIPVLFFSALLYSQPKINIIPQPVNLQLGDGAFLIEQNTAVIYNKKDNDLKAAAAFLLSHIKAISGYYLPQNKKGSRSIELKMEKNDALGKEGYTLNVTPTSIVLSANNKTGLVYAMQSLFQTLPVIRTNAPLEVPAMSITDYPRFPYRGMHLDVSRHFFSPEVVREFIDLMAIYKFNTFHWHLTDDQGWRIEIKKYPKLTSVGAWRVDRTDKPWELRERAKPGEKPTYGGYYTKEQIKDIVAYASERNITIIPEIEMPGHAEAAIAAYPFLSCIKQPQFVITGGQYPKEYQTNFCAGNDSIFVFLENVLTEIMELFPSQYIHIGGDEVDKASWKTCKNCQQRMKDHNLKNVDELQS